MGSFNETCALSNLNIPDGCPVRLLFLTQNPYVSSDEREAYRGCYHTDLWFARTPPLKGEYDDYGRAALADSPLVGLVAEVFSTDVVERPFGFNQYHAHPVMKGKDLPHYLQAAWDGRLLVKSYRHRGRVQEDIPDNFPTWERVFELFRGAGLPLQHDEDKGGYNAMPVIPGVVCVRYNSYGKTHEYLVRAEEVLSGTYDCREVSNQVDREQCLLVTAKGAFDDPLILVDKEPISRALSSHPEYAWHFDGRPPLPVLAVMVREDVWQVFCKVPLPKTWSDTDLTLKSIRKQISEIYEKRRKKRLKPKKTVIDMFEDDYLSGMRNLMTSIPSMTMAETHIKYAIDHDFEPYDELVTACAELARVEIVMARLHRPWYIPPLGGQEGEWELHTNLLSKICGISRKEAKEEAALYDEEEDEEG